MASQWRWIPGMVPQRDGIDFTTFDMELQSAGVKPRQKIEVFRDIKAMERAALDAWRKMQK